MATAENTTGTDPGNQVVGKVVILYGNVKAISIDGTERVLGPNSPIFAYDRIITESDGRVSIIMDDPAQSQIDVGRMSHIIIDEDIFAGVTAEDVAAAAADIEQIQEALLAEGFDPTVELEAPAAGGSAAAGGGHPVPEFARVTHEGEVTSGAETTGDQGDTVDPIPGAPELPDPSVTVEIDAEGGFVPEGVDAVFTVTINDASEGAQLTLGLSDETALATSDYNLTTFQYDDGSGWQNITGPISLSAGTNTILVRTDTVADNVDEPDETFSLSAEVVNENGASASGSAIATIVDGDIPTVTVSDDIKVEGDTEIFTVNVTKAADGAELTLNLTDGSAEAPADYNATTFEYSTDGGDNWQGINGPITLTEGSHELLVRTDTAVDDLLEGDENFFLNAELTNEGGDPVADSGEGIIVEGTLPPEDDPEPEPEPVTLNVSDDLIQEGDDGVFTVTVGNAPGGAQLNLGLSEGSADTPADYNAVKFEYNDGSGWTSVSGPIDIPAGDSSLQVRTDTVDDSIDEENETFFVNASISDTQGTIIADTGTGVIQDNDVPPQNILFDSNENVSTPEGTPLNGNILNNTFNPDGPSTASVTQFTVSGATYNAGQTANITDVGSLAIYSNGSFTFTPDPEYNGAVPVASYNVTDGEDNDISTLSITVEPANDPPTVTVTAANTFTEGTAAAGDVAFNYTGGDPDGSVTYSLTDDSGGYLAFGAAGQIVLTASGAAAINADVPISSLTAEVTVTEVGQDGLTDVDDASTTVDPVNDPPTVTVTAANTFTEGSAAAGDLAFTYTGGDPDGSVTYSLTDDSGGYLAFGAAGQIVLTASGAAAINADVPISSLTAEVTVTEVGQEGLTDVDDASTTVDPVNDPPTVTVTAANTFTEGSAAAGDLAFTYTGGDPDGSVTYSLTNDSGGYLAFGAAGQIVLTASGAAAINADVPISSLTAEVTVTEVGQEGLTDVDDASTTVDPVNDAPLARPDTYSTDEDTQLTANSVFTHIDSGEGVDDEDADDVIPDDADVAGVRTDSGSSAVTPSGATVTVTTTQGGTVVMNVDTGTFTYDPPANFNGADTFDYQITDGTNSSNWATVTINVAPINDPPEFLSVADQAAEPDIIAPNVDTYSYDVDEGTTSGTMISNNEIDAFDVDGDTLTYSIESGNGDGLFSINSSTGEISLTKTIDDADIGTYNLGIKVIDGNGGEDTATVTINLNDINELPEVQNRHVWMPDETLVNLAPTVDPSPNTSDGSWDSTHGYALKPLIGADPEGDTLTVDVDLPSSFDGTFWYNNGSTWVQLTGDATGLTQAEFESLHYKPDGDNEGDEITLSYTVSDGTDSTSPATITIHTVERDIAPSDPVTIGDPGGSPMTSGNTHSGILTFSADSTDAMNEAIATHMANVSIKLDYHPQNTTLGDADSLPNAGKGVPSDYLADFDITIEVDGNLYIVNYNAFTDSNYETWDVGGSLDTTWSLVDDVENGGKVWEASFNLDEAYLVTSVDNKDQVTGVDETQTLAGYLSSNPVAASDTWTINYNDGTSGNEQARYAQATFTYDPEEVYDITVTGTPEADLIYGGVGDDELSGAGEDDVIFGREGDDDIFGGAGDDTIYANDGSHDTIGDGGANDTLNYDSGIDSLVADPDDPV